MSHWGSMYGDIEDIGTPSAPPIMETGLEEDNSLGIEKEIEDDICRVENIAADSTSHLYRDAEPGGRYFHNHPDFHELCILFCGPLLMRLPLVWCSLRDTQTGEHVHNQEFNSDELDCQSIRLLSISFSSEFLLLWLTKVLSNLPTAVVNMLGKVFLRMTLA